MRSDKISKEVPCVIPSIPRTFQYSNIPISTRTGGGRCHVWIVCTFRGGMYWATFIEACIKVCLVSASVDVPMAFHILIPAGITEEIAEVVRSCTAGVTYILPKPGGQHSTAHPHAHPHPRVRPAPAHPSHTSPVPVPTQPVPKATTA